MNSDVLYINEKKADITGVNISINLQVNDLFEVSGRQSSFSNTIDLPKTEKNIAIFRGLSIESNISETPYRFQNITYLKEGIQLFANATGIVKETSENFKLNIYFNNNNLFELIEGKNLSDLDSSNLNHDLTVDEYRDRVDGNNLIYALANYGAQQDDVIILDYQTPSIKVSYLWNKIFAESGFQYRYTGRGNRNDYNPFLTDEFLNSYITLDKGFNREDSALPPVPVYEGNRDEVPDFSRFSIVFPPILGGIRWALPFEVIYPIRFNRQIQEFDKIIAQTISGRTRFVIQESGYYKTNLSGNLLANQIQELNIRIVSTEGTLATVLECEQGNNEVGFEERYYFQEGQSFSFEIQALNEESNQPLEYSYSFNLKIDQDNQEVRVNTNQYLESISQKDFIKDVCNFFGLTFVNKGSVYEFITYQELFNIFARYNNFDSLNPVNYIFEDWSYKFSRLVNEKYKIGNYGRRNDFKYKYDNDLNTFADGFLEIDNQTLEGRKTVLNRLYKAPENETISVNNTQLIRMDLYEIDGEKVKSKTSAPYIFIPQRIEGSFKFKRDGGSELTYNGFYNVAKFQNLSWQNSLTKWNSGLFNVLNRQNIIEAEIALNEYDVSTLDFFKLKYIKQLGAMFYLNKVKSFQNAETTTVELIKVQPAEQQGAFSDAFSDAFDN